ncbi:MAG: carbohydrate ABC transporter permease, partial [Clostridia bacterium]
MEEVNTGNNNFNPFLKRKRKTSTANRAFDFVKILVIFCFIVFTLLPIISVITTSISPGGESSTFFPTKIDWFAIKHVLTDTAFYTSFGVTILVVVLGSFISVLCMSMLGYALSKKNLPFRKTIFVFFLIAMLFSGGMVPNYIMMNTLKLTDTIFALVFPNVVNVMHVILIKNYFEDLPDSLEESAKMDGAGNFQIFFKVILPMSLPMIVTITLFTAVIYWNNYTNALLYISSQA